MFESCDDILSVDDIAAILKVGNTQVYKLLRSGRLKAYKEGKDWKIPILRKHPLQQALP